jgi:branched-chain amino acid transport system substrate-binding protein
MLEEAETVPPNLTQKGRRKMRYWKRMVLMIVTVMTVGFAVPATWAAEPYKIGFSGPLSGPAAFMGDVNRKTAVMLAEQMNAAGGINGHPIELITYDSENKPDVALQVFNRLIKRDRVLAIVGPVTSVEAMGVLSLVEQEKVPTIMLPTTKVIVEPIRKYAFKVAISEADAVNKSLDYLKEQGKTRIAMVTSQDSYGEAAREVIENMAPAKGIQIILKEKVGMDDKDMTPVVFKIKNSGAQALYEWTHVKPSIILTRNIKQIGLDIPVLHSVGYVNESNIETIGAAAIEGHYGGTYKFMDVEALPDSDPQKAVLLKYQRDFVAKYKERPTQFGVNAHDAMYILAAALKKAGPNRDKIRDEIENTKNYVGAGGIFDYSPTRHTPNAEKVMIMYRVVNGKWTIVK